MNNGGINWNYLAQMAQNRLQMATQQEALNNPLNRNRAVSTIQQYGGDGQKAFYAECQRMGIEPNAALQQIKLMYNQIYGGNGR